MRIAITLVLILVAAGVAGAFALGQLVAEDDLRARIVEHAQAASDRQVAIEGRVDLEFLPRPTITVGETRFLDAAADGQTILGVDRIDLVIAPFALLRGEIEVDEVRLVRPRFRLTAPDQEPVGLLQLLGAQAPIDLPPGLDRLSVIDGEMVIGAAAADALIVNQIDVRIEAEADHGPFFARGSFVAGDPFRFAGRLGRLTSDPNTTVSLELESTPEASEALALTFQGIVSLDRLTVFKGEARLSGSRLDAALDLLAPPLDADAPPLALATPFAIEGLVESDGERGEIADLDLRLGPLEGSGRLGVTLAPRPRLVLDLDIPRIDTAEPGVDPKALLLAAGLHAEGEIALSIGTLVHRGDVAARDVRLKLVLQPDQGVLLSSSRAVLPGGTDILGDGLISLGSEPRFEGHVSAVTDRAGELLHWLEPDLPLNVTAPFHTLSVDADVILETQRLSLHALDGRLDASKLAGAVDLGFGDRPAVRADLAIDRLSLDRYLPQAADIAGLLDRLRETDLDLELALERVLAGSTRLSDVAVLASVDEGRLELETVRAELPAETSVRLTGSLDLAAKAATLDLALQSAAPGPLLRRAGYAPAFSLTRLGELAATIEIDGWTGAAEVDARATLGDIRSGARGYAALDDQDGTLSLDLEVDLLHPQYAELLEEIGLVGLTESSEPLAGAFKVRRQSAGDTELVGQLSLGDSRITGELNVARGEHRPRVEARLSVADPTLSAILPLIALAGYRVDALALARPLPGAWPAAYLDLAPLRALDGRLELSGRGWAEQAGFEALVTSEQGVLRLERGRLALADDAGEVALEGTLDVRQSVPVLALIVEASDLAFDRLPEDLGPALDLSGRLDLYGELSAAGATFRDLVRSSSGDLVLSVQDGTITLPAPQAVDQEDVEAVPLDLLEVEFAIGRGLAEVKGLDLDTAGSSFTGGGLVDLLIWMVDLTLEERDGDRRIHLVGPPGDVVVVVPTPDAGPPVD